MLRTVLLASGLLFAGTNVFADLDSQGDTPDEFADYLAAVNTDLEEDEADGEDGLDHLTQWHIAVNNGVSIGDPQFQVADDGFLTTIDLEGLEPDTISITNSGEGIAEIQILKEVSDTLNESADDAENVDYHFLTFNQASKDILAAVVREDNILFVKAPYPEKTKIPVLYFDTMDEFQKHLNTLKGENVVDEDEDEDEDEAEDEDSKIDL